MKKTSLIVSVVILALFFLTVTTLFYSFYIIKDVQIFPADVHISEDLIGFNLDKDKIHFGVVPKNKASSNRFVTINNTWDHGIGVIIKGQGDLKGMIYSEIEENNETVVTNYIYLKPYESKEITLFIMPSKDEEVGFYQGTIKIILKRYNVFS